MLNGLWVIRGGERQQLAPEETGFLPSGTRVRLRMLGPSRLALEEDRGDELGGTVTLEPPYPSDLCDAPIARSICRDGRVIRPDNAAQFDALFKFSRWTKDDLDDPANELLIEQGAGRGSAHVVILVPEESMEWSLWISGRSRLVGQMATEELVQPVSAIQEWIREGAT